MAKSQAPLFHTKYCTFHPSFHIPFHPLFRIPSTCATRAGLADTGLRSSQRRVLTKAFQMRSSHQRALESMDKGQSLAHPRARSKNHRYVNQCDALRDTIRYPYVPNKTIDSECHLRLGQGDNHGMVWRIARCYESSHTGEVFA